MYTRYNVVNKLSKDVYCTVFSLEEAQQVVDMEKINHPHWELIVEKIEVSSIKPGFGRDPDLH